MGLHGLYYICEDTASRCLTRLSIKARGHGLVCLKIYLISRCWCCFLRTSQWMLLQEYLIKLAFSFNNNKIRTCFTSCLRHIVLVHHTFPFYFIFWRSLVRISQHTCLDRFRKWQLTTFSQLVVKIWHHKNVIWSISKMILEELQHGDIRLCLLKCLHTFFVLVDNKQASHTVLINELFEVLVWWMGPC